MSDSLINFSHAFETHQQAIQSVMDAAPEIIRLVKVMQQSLQAGGKVLWMGNGGSAADAQHMAAELMVRYVKNRRPLGSIALTTDTSLLTAHTNDFEFETLFSRQIEALAKPQDIVIGMTTSGKSQNVLNGLAQAKQMGCVTVALIGKQPLANEVAVDFCFQIAVSETARIQEAHGFISHLICEGLESTL